jgi:starch-binding outer membrane protein SusE/F
MKQIQLILSAVVSCLIIFSGCDKVDDLPYYNNGTAVTLTASKTSVAPTPADSTKSVIDFNWTSPKYSTDTSTHKFVLEIDSSGRNFATATRRTVTGKLGTSLTGRELNALLLDFGFAIGSPHKLEVRVISSYANNNERLASNVVTITVTPYTDPSVFSSTATSTSGTLGTADATALTFSWTQSFTGYTGGVTYTIQYDSSGKNFASPQEITTAANSFSKAMTNAEMNTAAVNEGVTMGSIGKIEFRIKATTARGAVSFSNAIPITIQTYVSILRFYLPGSYQTATGQGTDWTPNNAPEFIRDVRTNALNRLYYMYIFLPANAEFKVTQGRSWNINYGGSGGNLSASGGNLKVTTAGVYRISIDVVSMKYDISAGRMGFVGAATGAGWTPGNVFPNYALGAPETNLFVGLTDFTVNEWKLIDNNQWNNGSNAVDETRTYGSTGPSGSPVVVNGPNFPAPPTAGRYRVIWDGRDRDNVKYEMSRATEMRLVGDGINQAGVNDWDPATSPQMTYLGNGVWRITIGLKANKDIKFLAGNAWGAFDYEDNSNGSQAVGTARKIKWEGGNNFKTPTTAGTYTITLNEHTQTMTIAP